jgi:hypothetical protein
LVGQRDATSVPLASARRLNATGKGVRLASIPFICDHTSLNLPVREIVISTTNSGNQTESLHEGVLDLARIQRMVGEGPGRADALGYGNCDTMRRRVCQWDSRDEEGENGKETGGEKDHMAN